MPKRQTKMAISLLRWFEKNKGENLSFGQLLEKYCLPGESRYKIANKFTQMTNGEVIVKPSSLWNEWKRAYENNETSYVINSKFSGNKLHGNSGRKKVTKRFESNRVIFHCSTCNGEFSKNFPQMKAPNYSIELKQIKCPRCVKITKIVAKMLIDGKYRYKTIIEEKETFIKPQEIIPKEEREEWEKQHGQSESKREEEAEDKVKAWRF